MAQHKVQQDLWELILSFCFILIGFEISTAAVPKHMFRKILFSVLCFLFSPGKKRKKWLTWYLETTKELERFKWIFKDDIFTL